MRIYVDTASLSEIEEWAAHPWVSGFTTNPTLMRARDYPREDGVYPHQNAMDWAREAVRLAAGKPISIDGPPEVWKLGGNVHRKVTYWIPSDVTCKINLTAICSRRQVPKVANESDIFSVFVGRIMDTGRDPQPVINAAKQTGAQVLWASVREPYNITQAEAAGCDIVTVPPPILRKYLEWNGKPLEVVAAETIAQFDRDREGLW